MPARSYTHARVIRPKSPSTRLQLVLSAPCPLSMTTVGVPRPTQWRCKEMPPPMSTIRSSAVDDVAGAAASSGKLGEAAVRGGVDAGAGDWQPIVPNHVSKTNRVRPLPFTVTPSANVVLARLPIVAAVLGRLKAAR